MRVIQALILGFIAMVGAMLVRASWQDRPDQGVVLAFLLVVLSGIFLASTLEGKPNDQK